MEDCKFRYIHMTSVENVANESLSQLKLIEEELKVFLRYIISIWKNTLNISHQGQNCKGSETEKGGCNAVYELGPLTIVSRWAKHDWKSIDSQKRSSGLDLSYDKVSPLPAVFIISSGYGMRFQFDTTRLFTVNKFSFKVAIPNIP